MELISIFADDQTKEGLYAIRYDDEELDEFHRLLTLWSDIEHIRNYLKFNEAYLKSDFFKSYLFSELVTKIFKEAQELDDLFLDAEERFFTCSFRLQELFRPLTNSEYAIPLHQQTKSSIRDWKRRRALLRFYALRISENAYVITGGAIKLVGKMSDHPDTNHELENKIPKVKKYLASIDLNNEDDLKFVL